MLSLLVADFVACVVEVCSYLWRLITMIVKDRYIQSIMYKYTENFIVRTLFPSFAPPETWRNPTQVKKLEGIEWRKVRQRILLRDNYTCQYCGYYSEKYQIVHHLDGNPENNSDNNFTTICQMCNLIEHSGQGCVVQGVVDLYKKAKYSQNDISRMTLEMRDNGKTDNEIIQFLGLEEKVPFKMDRDYLKGLIGFVTSRPTRSGNEMFDKWREYHKTHH